MTRPPHLLRPVSLWFMLASLSLRTCRSFTAVHTSLYSVRGRGRPKAFTVPAAQGGAVYAANSRRVMARKASSWAEEAGGNAEGRRRRGAGAQEEGEGGSSKASLLALRVVDLKDKLRARGLPVSGNKAQLVDRLSGSSPTTTAVPPTKRKRVAQPKAEAGSKERVAPTRASIPRSSTPRRAERSRSGTGSGQAAEVDDGVKMRLLSWNVNGIRAVLRKPESVSALKGLVEKEKPNLITFQETKIQEQHIDDVHAQIVELLPGYKAHWSCSVARLGYSGTAMLIREECEEVATPLKVEFGIGQSEGDAEGRVITLTYTWGYVVTVYTPNAGDGLKRLDFRTQTWDVAFGKYIQDLSDRNGFTPVLVCGDLNAAHHDVDFFNPHEKRTLTQACTTPQERSSFVENILREGRFVDTFRQVHPSAEGVYSYWSVRARNRPFNRGMRIDYWLAATAQEADKEKATGSEGEDGSGTHTVRVLDSFVLDTDTVGVSDHCPVGIDIAIGTVPK